jgi:hypothetical protein
MFSLTKHEKLSDSLFVIGALLIEILKKEAYNVEGLYRKLLEKKAIGLDSYFDAITFLWLSDIVEFREEILFLRANDKTL